MIWQDRLIKVYLKVCDTWKAGVCNSAERMSNNRRFDFTDEEVVTIYLFGIMSGRRDIREIYTFTKNHLLDWFPRLSGYNAFVHRLQKLAPAFMSLSNFISEDFEKKNESQQKIWLTDSFPIVTASGKRKPSTKIAPELINKGYCASKDMFFYGVKLHVIGRDRMFTTPFPEFVLMNKAGENDLTSFKQYSQGLHDGHIFGDKAYVDKEMTKRLKEEQRVKLFTPIKKIRDVFSFKSSNTFSTWVSHWRQPIESLFSWMQEKTSIQVASKVRSASGLLVHVYGRLASAMLMLLNF